MAENKHCYSKGRKDWRRETSPEQAETLQGNGKLASPRPAPGTHNHLISTGLWVEPTHGSTACSTGVLSSEPASLLACCFPWWLSHAPGISTLKRSSLQFRLSLRGLHTMVSQGLLVGNPVNVACHQWRRETMMQDSMSSDFCIFDACKPASRGWYWQVLLPARDVAWHPSTATVMPSVWPFVAKPGKALPTQLFENRAALAALSVQGLSLRWLCVCTGQSLQ